MSLFIYPPTITTVNRITQSLILHVFAIIICLIHVPPTIVIAGIAG